MSSSQFIIPKCKNDSKSLHTYHPALHDCRQTAAGISVIPDGIYHILNHPALHDCRQTAAGISVIPDGIYHILIKK